MAKLIAHHLRWWTYQARRRILWGRRWRPRRMYRGGRPEDRQFTADERLYFRCKKDWIEENGSVKPANVHFPDQSVNREKYSRSNDVLIPDSSETLEWIYWGVAFLKVGDIPGRDQTTGNVFYDFTVEHDPVEDNFGHSEMRVYKSGIRERDKSKINNQVKKRYRTEVGLKSRVICVPLE